MSRKSKGINAERELVHLFWGHGWACIRVAGSGSSKYPSPDLIAGNGPRKLAIECKVSKSDSKYFSREEVYGLSSFSATMGTESWVAIKFNASWVFSPLRNLKQVGVLYVINTKNMGHTYLSFNELIKH